MSRKTKAMVYAVKQGRKQGLFNSWGECQEVVKGYPGAVFAGFKDVADACKYLGIAVPVDAVEGSAGSSPTTGVSVTAVSACEAQKLNADRVWERRLGLGGYVAVTYAVAQEKGSVAYAWELYFNNVLLCRHLGMLSESLGLNNIGGEFYAIREAVRFFESCLKANGVDSACRLALFAKYEGFHRWLVDWSARSELAQEYVHYTQKKKERGVLLDTEVMVDDEYGAWGVRFNMLKAQLECVFE